MGGHIVRRTDGRWGSISGSGNPAPLNAVLVDQPGQTTLSESRVTAGYKRPRIELGTPYKMSIQLLSLCPAVDVNRLI
ncbi:jg13647 [Pararge aegeria aegeria]|uniref:Jg13647 protein n=1 Tax=Pararge aegeria aegeria TaxID=348720 RepID=A0A8S4SNA9_9NEOP|nr:jg13647 [Pararge aegeria aegeria]